MWKKVGSVCSGEDKSVRSNKSRLDMTTQPFKKGLKKRSNISPEANRSFCNEYFEKRRNNTLNMTVVSNKSEKDMKKQLSRDDLFTQMRNRANQQGSRLDSLQDNPEIPSQHKGHQNIKQTVKKLQTLKKDHTKLRNSLENQFDSFKNFFYQIQEKLYQKTHEQSCGGLVGQKVDEDMIKGLLSEAFEVEKYFIEMDKKKNLIMQQLAG